MEKQLILYSGSVGSRLAVEKAKREGQPFEVVCFDTDPEVRERAIRESKAQGLDILIRPLAFKSFPSQKKPLYMALFAGAAILADELSTPVVTFGLAAPGPDIADWLDVMEQVLLDLEPVLYLSKPFARLDSEAIDFACYKLGINRDEPRPQADSD
jgi:hypothetical protein